jgi:hypothetical protein
MSKSNRLKIENKKFEIKFQKWNIKVNCFQLVFWGYAELRCYVWLRYFFSKKKKGIYHSDIYLFHFFTLTKY